MSRTTAKLMVTRNFSAIVALVLLTAGCSVTPEPLEDSDHEKRVTADLKHIKSAEFIPDGPLTLHAAMARAVALNLPNRIKQIETDIANAELDQSRYAMLPVLETRAGANTSNVRTSRTEDKSQGTGSASLTWNALDLGVSYARAKQNADAVLIARENERKALQDIMRDVRAAYWRAATAEKMMVEVRRLIPQLRLAVARSHDMERQRLQDARTSTAYRRDLIDAARQVVTMKRELDRSKAELAELLHIKPGSPFVLAASSGARSDLSIPMSLADMERHALRNRPEIRIENYNERVSEWQAKEAFYKMLPGLEVNTARNFSSDGALLNGNWMSAALNLSMNIFSLFSSGAEEQAAEYRAELARRKRLAVSLAVLTQVHVAFSKYQSARQQLHLASETVRTDGRLLRLIGGDRSFQSTNYLDVVKLITRKFRSDVDEQTAYADLVQAHSELIHAIGLDAIPEGTNTHDVASISGAIKKVMAGWETASPRLRAPGGKNIYRLIDAIFERADPNPEDLEATAIPAAGGNRPVTADAAQTPITLPAQNAPRTAIPTLAGLRPDQGQTPDKSPNAPKTAEPETAFSLQLGAFRGVDAARAVLLKSMEKDKGRQPPGQGWIEQTETGSGQAIFKVHIGIFESRESASGRCGIIKKNGGKCFLRAL